jgi:hypothetical protein
VSIQIQAGKFYRRRDGQVVGPAEPRGDKGSSYPWSIAGLYYTSNGMYQAHGPACLINEVEVRDIIPPPTIAERLEKSLELFGDWRKGEEALVLVRGCIAELKGAKA